MGKKNAHFYPRPRKGLYYLFVSNFPEWTCPTLLACRIPSESTSRIVLFLLSTWPSPSSGFSPLAPGLLTLTRIVTFRFNLVLSFFFSFRLDLLDFHHSFCWSWILELNTKCSIAVSMEPTLTVSIRLNHTLFHVSLYLDILTEFVWFQRSTRFGGYID